MWNADLKDADLAGGLPDSWCCVDCGMNTAPGCSTRSDVEKALRAGVIRNSDTVGRVQANETSELYTVRKAVWANAGMKPFGGCLCIGCLERRLGRELEPKDFQRDHPFNDLPGTKRLMDRRNGEGAY